MKFSKNKKISYRRRKSRRKSGGKSRRKIMKRRRKASSGKRIKRDTRRVNPVFRLYVTNDVRDTIERFLMGERDALFNGYFIEGESDYVTTNLVDRERRGPMSIADLSQSHGFGHWSGPARQRFADRWAAVDTARHIENMAAQPTVDVTAMDRPSSERVAERLGVYERLLKALQTNSFTTEERQHMLDLTDGVLEENFTEQR